MHRRFTLILVCSILVSFLPAHAELIRLEITERARFAEGKEFGSAGGYERIVGRAHLAVDPGNRRNQAVVDLELAPRNAQGKVECAADFFLLAPIDPSKGNGTILYDVNNRGNKLALGMFNDHSTADPKTVMDAGNGFLLREGYAILWSGWIAEVLPGPDKLRLHAPIATQNGQPIRGLVRFETSVDRSAESAPIARREGHGSYPPTPEGERDAILTWRRLETDERVIIPRTQWSLTRGASVVDDVPGMAALSQIRLHVVGGLKPGYTYELTYEAEGPIVQGLGFTATRDLISALKYSADATLPLRTAAGQSTIQRAIGFGVSQSGRYLRHFLYQGFNADEHDRIVFDGLMPHVAGGGLGYFNHRFAQPTRHNGQHEEHHFPGDMFPFTYGDATEPYEGRVDGIQRRLAAEGTKFLPKIMHTQSAAEYWHRSGSLVHTDPLGKTDAAIPSNVRIYAFGGTQHGPASYPPAKNLSEHPANPGDYKPQLRALLTALNAWIQSDAAPPASVYPRIDQGTLVDWRPACLNFPGLPGVLTPTVIQQPSLLDFGPQFRTKGLLTVHPPAVRGHYVVKASRVDADGNDLGCLAPIEVAAPVATHTGWNLRSKEAGAEGQLASLLGAYFPFPRTKQEREMTGDPRPSLQERYGSFEAYCQQFDQQASKMVADRTLLPEDVERWQRRRLQFKSLFESTPNAEAK